MQVSTRSCLGHDELVAFASDIAATRRAADADHVDSCATCRRKLDGLAATQQTAEPQPALDRTAAAGLVGRRDGQLPAGSRIGRHVVSRVLGAGAMGVVYEARDPELDRNVAIKLLRHDHYAGDDAMVARLKREARALAQLAHPNVVAIHDVGIHDGAPFIAMEHIHGDTLRRWLDRQPRSWREVTHLFEQAALGLAAAHATGMVHRDFKPDNVMIGDDARVRVMDFGLARAEAAVELADRKPVGQLDELMTASGAFIGTPAYMAPEQFNGEPTDARSDQYNFMVALYEALFGKRPFTAATLAELALAVTEGAPAPAPATVPRALRDLVMRGLAREPAERHRDMSDVAAQLARISKRSRRGLFVGGGIAAVALSSIAIAFATRPAPLTACEISAQRISRHWDGNARARIAREITKAAPIGSASMAHAAAALDDYSLRWRALARETCEARGSLKPAIVEQRELCLDNRLRGVEALVSLWTTPTSEVAAVAAGAPGAVFALPSVAECASDNAIAVVPAVTKEQTAAVDRLRSRIANGRAQLTSGLGDRGITELRAVADEAAKLDLESFAAEAELALGSALADRALVLDARSSFDRARVHAENAQSPILIAEVLVRLVGVATATGALDGAVDLSKQAETALDAAGRPERLQLLLHRFRGHLSMIRGDLDLAAKDIDAATKLSTDLYGADSVEAAEAERLVGALAIFQQKFDVTRARMQHAIETITTLHGDRHPAIAYLHTQLCGLDAEQDPAAARPHCDAARTYYEAAGTVERAHLARVMWLGATLVPPTDARLDILDKARATLLETSGKNSLDVAQVTAGIATVHFNQRRYKQAAEAIAEQIEIRERALGASHPSLTQRYAALGRSWLLASDLRRASTAFEHCLALLEKAAIPEPDRLVQILTDVGNLRQLLGDPTATAVLDRAVALASAAEGSDPQGERLGSALLLVAGQLGAQSNFDGAVDYYGRALRVKHLPTRISALAGRASVHAMTGRGKREAIRDIAAARKLARKAPQTSLLVEAGACAALVNIEQWKAALKTCSAITAKQPTGSPLAALIGINIADAQLGLGRTKAARKLVEELATMDPTTLGVPTQFRAELMAVVARVRRADGDDAAALAAADEADGLLVGLGLEGAFSLGKLRAWRDKPAIPSRPARRRK